MRSIVEYIEDLSAFVWGPKKSRPTYEDIEARVNKALSLI